MLYCLSGSCQACCMGCVHHRGAMEPDEDFEPFDLEAETPSTSEQNSTLSSMSCVHAYLHILNQRVSWSDGTYLMQ